MNTQDLGKRGEEEAVGFLRRSGYRIVRRNARTQFGEIDVIARHDHALVFIEVKTRSGTSHGLPAEAVTEEKTSHLKKAAEWYMLHNRLSGDVRFEVVSVLWSDSPACEIIPLD